MMGNGPNISVATMGQVLPGIQQARASAKTAKQSNPSSKAKQSKQTSKQAATAKNKTPETVLIQLPNVEQAMFLAKVSENL